MDGNSKQIFKSFTDATVALMDCEDLPAGVEHALSRLVDEFGNECNGNDVFNTTNHTRQVMSKVFDLDDKEEETPKPDSADDYDERKAALELAYAFATIAEYRDYLPDRFYRNVDDWISDFYAEADWTNSPEMIRLVGPHVLRLAMKNIAAKESH